jgi:hypothetical protein
MKENFSIEIKNHSLASKFKKIREEKYITID